MRCPNCKEVISDKATFCPKCGTQIMKNETTLLSKKKGFKSKIAISFITVMVVIIAGIVFKLYVSDSSYAKKAEAAIKDEDYDAAIVYRALDVHSNPQNEDVYINLANAYMEKDEYSQAMTVLNIAKKNVDVTDKLYSKENEIEEIVGDDKENVEIKEYTDSQEINSEEEVKKFIEEIKDYNGQSEMTNREMDYYKGYLYYIDKDGIYKSNDDLMSKEKIIQYDNQCDMLGDTMKIVNNTIYWICPQVPGHLFSVNINGGNYRDYNLDNMSNVSETEVYHGWIYYFYMSDHFSGIARLNIQNNSIEYLKDITEYYKEKIDEGYRERFALYGRIINRYYYYIDNNNIVRTNLNTIGTDNEITEIIIDRKKIGIEGAVGIIKDNKLIYYNETEDENYTKYETYLYDMTTKKNKKLEIKENGGINTAEDNWLYGWETISKDNKLLFRINMNTLEKEELGSGINGYIETVYEDKVIVKIYNEDYDEKLIALSVSNKEKNQEIIDKEKMNFN